MRLAKKAPTGIVEGDLTPMIDMTFQLIAFFMLVINFSDVEQDQRVTLPASELAKPPSAPYEHPLTIHLTPDDTYIFGGNERTTLAQLKSDLLRETQIINRHTTESVADVTVIIRADADIDYQESGGIHAGYAEIKPWLAEMLPTFFPKRMHTIGQVEVVFDGADAASVVAYFDNPMPMADGSGGEKIVEIGGMYHHEMVRTAEGWRSRKLYEQVIWKRGL